MPEILPLFHRTSPSHLISRFSYFDNTFWYEESNFFSAKAYKKSKDLEKNEVDLVSKTAQLVFSRQQQVNTFPCICSVL